MTEPAHPLPAVGLTALGVAAIRAAESSRSDRLFDDPCAAGFVRTAGYERPNGETDPTMEQIPARQRLMSWIAVRTRFLDDVMLSACAGACRQVVILGAGLDARAFRLDWPPGTQLWELDLGDVLEFKELVINAEGWVPRCERRIVPVDLSAEWGRLLVAAGFDPHAPVAWLAEGLLAYLAPDVRDALVGGAAGLSVSGSRMGLTLASPGRLEAWKEAHPDGKSGPGDYMALWRSAAPEDATEWLASLGWQAEIFNVAERSVAYGRPPEQAGGNTNRARLVSATRS
jgi:methyltransferase (TIGR00027 family)